MSAQPQQAPRFIRKTQLAPNEYRKNFHQLDDDIILAITSPEADRVTPLMSKIYLRLTTAPAQYWERDGVLRFEAEWREGKHFKAWSVLCEVLGVASATASKALTWMHDAGVIGYFAGKNGVGIRVFLNRATNSIGSRATQGGKKILPFAPASPNFSAASANEPAFKDSFAVPDGLDSDHSPRAPKNGAATETRNVKQSPDSGAEALTASQLVQQLLAGVESILAGVVRREGQRGFERMRDWLDHYGIPKATRVAVHEGYRVAAREDSKEEKRRRHEDWINTGRNDLVPLPGPHPLSDFEVVMYAEMCVELFSEKGVLTDAALSDLSAEAGGMILPEDAPRVRAAIEGILNGKSVTQQVPATQEEESTHQPEDTTAAYHRYLARALEDRLDEISPADWRELMAAEKDLLLDEIPSSRIFKDVTMTKILEARLIEKLRAGLRVKSYDEFVSER